MSATGNVTVPDRPEILPAVCPVSGLPIRAHPEWVYTNPQRTYRTTIALIGDAMYWVIPRGYISVRDMAAATTMAAGVLRETNPTATPYVFIEDFAHTRGGTAGARRLYLRFTNTLKGLLGSFPYGMPPFFRLSFNFSRRLHLHRYKVHMVPRYDDAVTSSLEMLRRNGVFPGLCDPVAPGPLGHRGPRTGISGHASVSVGDAFSMNALSAHGDDLLSHLCSLDLESSGVPAPPDIGPHHPMQPVYDALLMLKMDMDRFLVEHLALVADLEARHTELLEKTAAIEARNRQLQALLQQSSEDQAALGKTALHNIETLLQPLLRIIDRDTCGPLLHEWLKGLNSGIDASAVNLFPRLDLQHYRLTPQEIRIARMVRDGHPSLAIARRMGLSIRTVESFRRRLREKLGIRGCPRNLRTALQSIPDN